MSEQTETTTKKAKKSKTKTQADARTWSESLDVKMTEKELADLAPRIDSAIAEVESLEEQKKAASDGFKARIELAEAHVRELRAFAASGKKKADVVVVEKFLFEINSAVVTRTDTGEEVRRRALSIDERQASLPLPGEPLTATVGEVQKAKRGRKPADVDPLIVATAKALLGEQCPKVLDGKPCTRAAGHRGAHGYRDAGPKA